MFATSARWWPVRHVRRLLTLVAVAVVLVACGSGDDGSEAEATTTSAPTSAEGDTSTTASPDPEELALTSSAFEDGASLPARFSCTAEGVSPPLSWSGVPEGASSVALVVVDPDAPVEDGFTHWSLSGIDPAPGEVAEGQEPAGGEGQEWIPACPPTGTHRYIFTLYAFDDSGAPTSGDRAAIETAADNALGTASITGTYSQE